MLSGQHASPDSTSASTARPSAAPALSWCSWFRQGLGALAKEKKFERGFQATGWVIGIPVGICAAIHEGSRSLPLIGTAASNLPSAFYRTLESVGGVAGTFANYFGNFGGAADIVVNVTCNGRSIRDLSWKEWGQVSGAVIGTGATLYLLPYIATELSAAPIASTVVEILPTGLLHAVSIPYVGGYFANILGHSGKGQDDSLFVVKNLWNTLKSCVSSTPPAPEKAEAKSNVAEAKNDSARPSSAHVQLSVFSAASQASASMTPAAAAATAVVADSASVRVDINSPVR